MNKINFKKWAFRFTIYILIMNIVAYYLTVNYVYFPGVESNIPKALIFLGILGRILLLLALVCIVASSLKNEERNYQYYVSIIGIVLLGLLPLINRYI